MQKREESVNAPTSEDWQNTQFGREFLKRHPNGTFEDFLEDGKKWWAEYSKPLENPHIACELANPCQQCQDASRRAYLNRLPEANRRWLKMLKRYPIIGQGIEGQHLKNEPAHTMPEQFSAEWVAKLVATLLDDQNTDPIIDALSRHIARIVNAVIDARVESTVRKVLAEQQRRYAA